MKAPVKGGAASAAVPAVPELEEGVIEIEVLETPAWSKTRLSRIAVLAGVIGAAAAGAVVLRSAELRALLLPGTQIRFSVVPQDAQVYVNGTKMPRPGSGTLRNVPPGRFSVKVYHPDYPAARTIGIETGSFGRRVEVAAGLTGISTK